MPLVEEEYSDWFQMLTQERREMLMDRFQQPPSEWPARMRAGVEELNIRNPAGCAEDMIQQMAEWMYRNPND